MMILQSIFAFFHMCVVPYLIGRAILHRKNKVEYAGTAYTTAAGLMVSWSLYEFLALAIQKAGGGFRVLSLVYLLLSLTFAVFGIVSALKEDGKGVFKKLFSFAKPDGYMIAAIILIAVQIGAVLFMATPDMDDAFYSGLSSMSLAHDYILEFDAYDGRMLSEISKRYMISALPIWQASLSLYTGMHHLVISHNLFPLFYMPLAYGLYYRMGKRFLQREGNMGAQGKFMFFFALMHMIGNYYVFSPENFLVTRMWQGKALFAAIGIPVLWLCGQSALFAVEERIKKADYFRVWLLVSCVLLACTFMGETGLFLGPFLLGCQTLVACFMLKKWKKIIPAVICCLPEAVLLLIYLV
jgi:hypothetical protein